MVYIVQVSFRLRLLFWWSWVETYGNAALWRLSLAAWRRCCLHCPLQMLWFHCRPRTSRFLCLRLRSPSLGVLLTAIWGCFWVYFYTSAFVVQFFFYLRTALRTVDVSRCGSLPSWWHEQCSVVGLWSALTQCSATLLSQVLPGSRFCLATEYSWLSEEISCGISQVVWSDVCRESMLRTHSEVRRGQRLCRFSVLLSAEYSFTEVPSLWDVQGLHLLSHPSRDFFVQWSIWRDCTAQVFECLHAFQFSPVNGDGWLRFGGVWGCLEQDLSLP